MLLEKNSESLIAGAGGGVAGGGTVTVTLASATAFPPGPVARAMYVVEADGLTVRLPEGSTVPTPLSMVTPVAFDEFHESVVDWPRSIADGDALRETVGAGDGAGGGGGGASFVAVGGGVGAFFAQPVPEITNANRTIAAATSVDNDLLIEISP